MYTLASFPSHSHCQYLIACSMQIWWGKAWEIWSRVVTSGRQRVDTQGGGVAVIIFTVQYATESWGRSMGTRLYASTQTKWLEEKT